MTSNRLTITVKRTGPYIIQLEDAAGVCIVDAEGNELIPEADRPIKLCRCGGSATKPFCDGTHKRIGFLAPPPDASSST
jgi:CDGSH-type Zn-finger protein